MARSVTDQSGRFSESSATRSPFLTPSAESPSATARTRLMIASPGMCSHCPPALRFTASGLACRSSARRHISGTVAGACTSEVWDSVIDVLSDKEELLAVSR
jgi:hypothetical protein